MIHFCLYKKCEGNSLVYESLFEAFRIVFPAVGGAKPNKCLTNGKTANRYSPSCVGRIPALPGRASLVASGALPHIALGALTGPRPCGWGSGGPRL